ncbi:MAG: hypothetical protein EOM67_16310, partial [Spirochaetia bacterium]|nr:hypothetical protein [Spirochaetia bacterium]
MSLEKYLEALDNGTTFTDVVREEYDDMPGAYWTAKLKMEKDKLRKRGMVDQANNLSMKDIMDKNYFKVTAKKDKFDFKTGKHFKEEVELDEGFADTYHATKLKVEKEKLRKRGMVDQAEKITLDDIKKKYPVKVSEDVDQIDEISKETAASYYDKAIDSLHHKKKGLYHKLGSERWHARKELKKIDPEAKYDETEKYDHPEVQKHHDNAEKIGNKIRKREAGIIKASKKGPTWHYRDGKMVKEDAEQIDEMRSPFHKAATELEKHAKKLGPNHMDHDDFMNHAKA